MDKKYFSPKVKYCAVTLRKISQPESVVVCFPVLSLMPEINEKDKILLFLNNVYSDNEYNGSEIIEINEVNKEQAERLCKFDPEVVFMSNFFEVSGTDVDGNEKLFCVTAFDGSPEPDIVLKCVNYSKEEHEKIERINWVRDIKMHDAVTRYNMGDWMWPCDVVF